MFCFCGKVDSVSSPVRNLLAHLLFLFIGGQIDSLGYSFQHSKCGQFSYFHSDNFNGVTTSQLAVVCVFMRSAAKQHLVLPRGTFN